MNLSTLYCNMLILRVMPFKIQVSSGFKYQFDRQQISLKLVNTRGVKIYFFYLSHG